MSGWLRIASFVIPAAAAVVAIVVGAIAMDQRRRQFERQLQAYGESQTRREIRNDDSDDDNGWHVRRNQNQTSNNSTRENNRLSEEAKRKHSAEREKLAKLRETRQKQWEEEQKKRKEQEEEKRKREKMESMLNSFDDAFDEEIGVNKPFEEELCDWKSNALKKQLKEDFRNKQMAEQQKNRVTNELVKVDERKDESKVEQQASSVLKCLIDKKFRIKDSLLRAIINVNMKNSYTILISLSVIKRNKKKKVLDERNEMKKRKETLKQVIPNKQVTQQKESQDKKEMIKSNEGTEEVKSKILQCVNDKKSNSQKLQNKHTQENELIEVGTIQKTFTKKRKLKLKIKEREMEERRKINEAPNFYDDNVYKDFGDFSKCAVNEERQLIEQLFGTKHHAQYQKTESGKETQLNCRPNYPNNATNDQDFYNCSKNMQQQTLEQKPQINIQNNQKKKTKKLQTNSQNNQKKKKRRKNK